MTNYLGRLSCIVLALTLVLLLGARPARAAQSITISPTSSEITMNPGEQYQGTIQVINQADSPFDYKAYTLPFTVTGENYDPSFTPIPGAIKAEDWVSLAVEKTRLDPYTSTNLIYKVSVPASAQPGGYYVVIFAETESKPLASTGVITKQRVGTKLYIRVAGKVQESGRVLTWQVANLQFPPLKQLLRIENSGAVYFPATIHTTVRDVFGAVKYDLKQRRSVFPGKIRKVEIVWDKTPAFGLFKVDGTVEYLGKSEPLAAQYVLVASQTVRNAAAILALALLIILLLRWIRRRRRRKRGQAKAQQAPPQV